MAKRGDRSERVKAWKGGTPLNCAWTNFGYERLRKLQKRKRGTPGSDSIQTQMVFDLFEELAAGKLIAWGYQTDPSASDGPVLIPADIFDHRPSDSWTDNIVETLGWRYERVAVLDPVLARTSDSDLEIIPATELVSATKPYRPGPRDTYELSADVLRDIFENFPKKRTLSAAKLLPDFEKTYKTVHADLSAAHRIPGERTLRKHLKKFFSEEIGKNRQK